MRTIAIICLLILTTCLAASDRAKLRGRSAWAWASCQQCQPATMEKKDEAPTIRKPLIVEEPVSSSCTTGNCSSYPMAGGGLFRRRGR